MASFTAQARIASRKGLTGMIYQEVGRTYDDLTMAYNQGGFGLDIRGRVRNQYSATFTAMATLLTYEQGQYSIYNSKGLTYDQLTYVYNNDGRYKSFTMMARIRATATKTLTVRADMRNTVQQSLQMRGRIAVRSTTTITLRGRISARTTATLDVRGRISATSTKTLSLRADIKKTQTHTINILARISAATTTTQSITLRGYILGNNRTIDMGARIIATSTKLLTSRGRIKRTTTRTISTQASIRYTSYLTSKARIVTITTRGIDTRSNILGSGNSSTSLRAYIVKIVSMTMRGHMRHKQLWGQLIKARIISDQTKTLTARGRINSTLRDMTMRGHLTRDLWMRARVARREGWPIPIATDANYETFIATQVYARANILGARIQHTSLDTQARIDWTRNVSMTMRANIRKASSIRVRASITPRLATTLAPMTYTISTTSERSVRMVFYMRGNQKTMALGVGASIERQGTVTVAAAFSVGADYSASVQTFYVTARNVAEQRVGMRARIE